MKRLMFLAISILVLALLSSCRPPELEGAFVDYNAGRYDNALKLAKQATQKYPNNPEAWYLLGELYGKKEQFIEMKKAFDKSLSISQQFATKIKRAELYYFQNLFNKAVNSYNAFTKIPDRNSDAAKKHLEDAIKNFKTANIVHPDYKAVDLTALCYGLEGKQDSALAYYKKLTEMAPDSADAYIKLGRFELVRSNYKGAIKALEQALKLDPNNSDAIQIIAEAYDRDGQTQKAIDAYQKAIKVNPKEKAFPFNLGLIYFKLSTKDSIDKNLQNEYLKKCALMFGKVIELDPTMKEPYDFKSNCEIQLKEYDQALATLKEAVQRFPKTGAFWFNLGVVYTHLNNAKEAQKAFDKAKALGVK